MSEFYNNDRENATFQADTSDVTEDFESRIGKPDTGREATLEEKSQSQETLITNITKRLEGMKKDKAMMEEGLVLSKKYDSNARDAVQKEQELIKLVRDQLDNGADNIPQQEALQAEVNNHREEANQAREELFATLPDGKRTTTELTLKIAQVEQDIAKEEEILEANTAELQQLNK